MRPCNVPPLGWFSCGKGWGEQCRGQPRATASARSPPRPGRTDAAMFTGKVIASLFLLAAAGFLDGQSPAAPQADGVASAARPAEAAVAPMPAQLQQAVHRELQDRLRRDLDDA